MKIYFGGPIPGIGEWIYSLIIPRCIGCGKTPEEIQEYIAIAKEENTTPTEDVKLREGTYNVENGHFACTECYIEMGMPSSPTGWIAP